VEQQRWEKEQRIRQQQREEKQRIEQQQWQMEASAAQAAQLLRNKRWCRRNRQQANELTEWLQVKAWVDWHQDWHRQILANFAKRMKAVEGDAEKGQYEIEQMRKAAREWAGAATLQAAQNPKLVEYAATCGKAITL
jgi:hypothetical protein